MLCFWGSGDAGGGSACNLGDGYGGKSQRAEEGTRVSEGRGG